MDFACEVVRDGFAVGLSCGTRGQVGQQLDSPLAVDCQHGGFGSEIHHELEVRELCGIGLEGLEGVEQGQSGAVHLLDAQAHCLELPEFFVQQRFTADCDEQRIRLSGQGDQWLEGVKELLVVAQDTSRYGIDLYGERKLPELLRELCKIEKLHWIRVHYLYPDEITDELIDVIASEPKIVKYLDIPMQHVNDKILKRMNRRGTRVELDELFAKLRARLPGVVIRTSLITGLPGEGEQEFEELCDWLREHKLERVGAFAFSPEEGTPAAKMDYPDSEIAVRRAQLVEELQSRVMDECNNARLGTVMEVLCEGFDPESGQYFGRTYADSPEIDGRILFSADRAVKVGSFVPVRVTDVCDGDLTGNLEEA